jgi:hypothetical protein
MIRVLDITDTDAVLEIAKIRPKRKETVHFTRENITDILSHEKNITIGFFVNGIMISWAAARFGTLHGNNVWYVISFVKRTQSNLFNYDAAGFGELMHYFRALGEKTGHYTYLYSIAVKAQRVYYDKWTDQKKYDIEDVAIIPAGTISESPWMARLIGGTKPYDVVIKQRTLKIEFRNNREVKE